MLKFDAIEESNLTLILTEAVTNILRHSQGDTVTFTLQQTPEARIFKIHSNGPVPSFQKGNGLRGIEERVASLGGQLMLSTQDGFQLEVHL